MKKKLTGSRRFIFAMMIVILFIGIWISWLIRSYAVGNTHLFEISKVIIDWIGWITITLIGGYHARDTMVSLKGNYPLKENSENIENVKK